MVDRPSDRVGSAGTSRQRARSNTRSYLRSRRRRDGRYLIFQSAYERLELIGTLVHLAREKCARCGIDPDDDQRPETESPHGRLKNLDACTYDETRSPTADAADNASKKSPGEVTQLFFDTDRRHSSA